MLGQGAGGSCSSPKPRPCPPKYLGYSDYTTYAVTFKIRQNAFLTGALPVPRWGSSQCSTYQIP